MRILRGPCCFTLEMSHSVGKLRYSSPGRKNTTVYDTHSEFSKAQHTTENTLKIVYIYINKHVILEKLSYKTFLITHYS